ncbi:hypothetical protein BOTBODRAFT_39492 [Botryobasidium botryosum FD-172 SS1]|uniref:Uncharacterized protein n=1 Tax=Botryobasidium botryosum (strain FD-172 SS1) TaxID=930990 RepID=A0A067LWA5_BOTB1|nr:hypothetical protein BOTBODRAFT_39492 [Botryobasidium botryosum FD-172 SS1]
MIILHLAVGWYDRPGDSDAVACGLDDEMQTLILMLECWDWDPLGRPTASQVVERLQHASTDAARHYRRCFLGYSRLGDRSCTRHEKQVDTLSMDLSCRYEGNPRYPQSCIIAQPARNHLSAHCYYYFLTRFPANVHAPHSATSVCAVAAGSRNCRRRVGEDEDKDDDGMSSLETSGIGSPALAIMASAWSFRVAVLARRLLLRGACAVYSDQHYLAYQHLILALAARPHAHCPCAVAVIFHSACSNFHSSTHIRLSDSPSTLPTPLSYAVSLPPTFPQALQRLR